MQISASIDQLPIATGPARLIDRRHAEWRRHHRRWTWLLDSLEGGEVYRQAIYGWDTDYMPIRNMIRHPHEYPDQNRRYTVYGPLGRPAGSDQYAQATDDPYELRRARTPVPMLLAHTIKMHLAKVFAEDAQRSGPGDVESWWDDVDGAKTSIRAWMKDTVGPLGLSLGQLDIICDHPALPEGAKREDIQTNADAQANGLNQVVANYLLPENVLWWKLNARGQYLEVLLQEPQEDGEVHYRHWTAEDWTLYDARNNVIEGPIDHPYGRPPIVRLFDKRRPRMKNVGLPRYEDIAEIQREIYNRSSELILSDTHQSHAIVQGPEEWCQGTASIPMGPNNLLPMKAMTGPDGRPNGYQGFEVVEYPKEGAAQLRTNILDLKDDADRSSGMTKPAGAAGTTGTTVGLSGISKRLDSDDGNQLLADVSETIGRWDREITELAALVMFDGEPPDAFLAEIDVTYPKEFDLFGPEESAGLIGDYQGALQGTGATPTADHQMVSDLYRKTVKGKPDEHYAAVDAEIKTAVARNAQGLSIQREATRASLIGENAPAAGDDTGTDLSVVDATTAGFGLQITNPLG